MTTQKKYCYIFTKENFNQARLEEIFGSTDKLNNSAQSAIDELNYDKEENNHWFSKMEKVNGPAIIVEVDVEGETMISYKKLGI